MNSWAQAIREGLVSGSIASVLSAIYLARCGRGQGAPAAPVNAVSHWIHGDPALRRDTPSWRHTATGYLIHHGASMFWGVIHAKTWSHRPEAKRPLPALAGAAVASCVACFVDYRLTPRRLTPGFEHHLSRREMALVYGWFAVGLAAGSLLMRRREKPPADRAA